LLGALRASRCGQPAHAAGPGVRWAARCAGRARHAARRRQRCARRTRSAARARQGDPAPAMKRLLLALLLLLAAPSSAQAAFGVSSFTVTPTTLQAGSHPDVSIALGFSGAEHVRDLTVSLPPGLVGNPNAVP